LPQLFNVADDVAHFPSRRLSNFQRPGKPPSIDLSFERPPTNTQTTRNFLNAQEPKLLSLFFEGTFAPLVAICHDYLSRKVFTMDEITEALATAEPAD
jgi:hypothetical protein